MQARWGLLALLTAGLMGCGDHDDSPPPAAPVPTFEGVGHVRPAADPDPAMAGNQVFEIDNTDTVIGGSITRPVGRARVSGVGGVETLAGQLALRAYLVGPKTCSGGSPRVSLQVDLTGDGFTQAPGGDNHAFGYLGLTPAGCPADTWISEDLTDGVARWDAVQVGGGWGVTWDALVADLNTRYPNHTIAKVAVVEDEHSWSGVSPGISYYDDVTLGTETAANHADVAFPPAP